MQLTPFQRRAVGFEGGNLRLIACAGGLGFLGLGVAPGQRTRLTDKKVQMINALLAGTKKVEIARQLGISDR